jgi:hypothetical protein
VLDGERLCDTENERARKVCTGGLMFVAAEDNVVLIEPKQKRRLATVWSPPHILWSKVDTGGFLSDAPDVEKLDAAAAAAAAEKAQGHVGCSFVLGDTLEREGWPMLTTRKKSKA